jgi:hypothetical protein
MFISKNILERVLERDPMAMESQLTLSLQLLEGKIQSGSGIAFSLP